MRPLLLSMGVVVCCTIAVVGSGQPPVLQPPAPAAMPPVAAAGPMDPAPENGPELGRFEPLAAFPHTTQAAVRSVLLGANWLTRMNQPHGRFQYGYLPALRQPMDGDHDLKQARAALALAQAARFTGDERQTAVAGQAILVLLAATRVDPADPGCRVPLAFSFTCNRLGFAALLASSIYALPGSDEKLLAEAERLCGFLRKQLRGDGSIHYTDGAGDSPTAVDPAGVNEYPGAALQALAAGQAIRPAAWKLEALAKGTQWYRGWFKAHPHPMLAANLTPAFAELYRQTKSNEAAAAVLEMNDWLVGLQYSAGDPRHPQWAGGFRGWADGRAVDAEPGFECGAYLQSLAEAYRLTRQNADVARADCYRPALAGAVEFVAGLQYTETNTRHFENAFRANVLIGGFHLSPTDGNVRIDAAAWSITGLLRFLSSGAARN